MLQRKQYFNEIKHIFIQFIEDFRPNHSNIKWLINRPCGTELVNWERNFEENIIEKYLGERIRKEVVIIRIES